jgi:hypothetical protein
LFCSSFCCRLIKEVAYYQQEAKDNEAKLQKMKDEKKDQYDIKMFNEVLLESYMMVKESPTRLHKALEDLSLFVDMNECDTDNEWCMAAHQILKEQGLVKEGLEETNVDHLQEGEAF